MPQLLVDSGRSKKIVCATRGSHRGRSKWYYLIVRKKPTLNKVTVHLPTKHSVSVESKFEQYENILIRVFLILSTAFAMSRFLFIELQSLMAHLPK